MPKINDKQKEALLNFMIENVNLGKGQYDNSFNKVKANSLWANLANMLNGMGTVKDIKKWKKTWSDIKVEAKRKASTITKDSCKTGGGSPKETPMSSYDERVLSIIGTSCIDGLSDIQEVGLPVLQNWSEEITYTGDDSCSSQPPEPPAKKRRLSDESTSRQISKKEQAQKWLETGENKAKAMMLLAENVGRVANSLELLATNVGRIASSFESYDNVGE